MDVLDSRFDFEGAMQARHVAHPMSRACQVREDEPATEAVARLTAKKYDCAPVTDAAGTVTGLFDSRTRKAGGLVSDQMQPLDVHALVTANTGIPELAGYLALHPFLFVLSGQRLDGFVTPADLNSVPVRTYCYLLMSDLEHALGALLRTLYPTDEGQEDAISRLSEGNRGGYEKNRGRLADDLIDPIAALEFHHLLELAKRTPLRDRYEAAHGSWSDLGGLVAWRNSVMHAVRPFTPTDVVKLQVRSARARALSKLARNLRTELVTESEGLGGAAQVWANTESPATR